MTLKCKVRLCANMLCITIHHASGWSESATSATHIVEAVHICFEAESAEGEIDLALHLYQEQEPHQPQARTVTEPPATRRVEQKHHRWDVEATGKLKGGGGPGTADVDAGGVTAHRISDNDKLADADEDLVLTRFIVNSNAFPIGTAFQLRRYADRCAKNEENLDDMSILTFNGASDPILLRGDVSTDDHSIVLYCKAKLDVAVIKSSTLGVLRGRPKMRDWEHFITPGHITRYAVFMHHRVAKISVE